MFRSPEQDKDLLGAFKCSNFLTNKTFFTEFFEDQKNKYISDEC